MLVPRRKRRVIDALREERPGTWEYSPRHGVWHSADREERVSVVHTGGRDINGEAMPGCSYYVYAMESGEHLGKVYP